MGIGMSFDERMKLVAGGPDLLELMNFLKMSKREKTKYLRLFQAIDKDSSGYISLIEWFVHMKMDHSKFVERAFRQMDINSEGESNQQLDVCEFFIGLMNFCFFPQEKLSRFMFDLYDDDKNGSITIAELELMITEICGPGKEDLVKKLMQLLDGDGSLDISYTEFMRVEKKAATVLAPCFTLQLDLQGKCMGRYFFRKKRKKVRKLLASENCESLVDFFAKKMDEEMPPPPEIDEDDFLDEDEEDEDEDEEEKTWEEIEAEKIEAEKQAKIDEYKAMDVFQNEFEEFRKFTEPGTGRDYWVNTKTKEELWECPAPGQRIIVGDFVRALDKTYERAYWYNFRTNERFWVLPEANHEGARKYTKQALALRRARGFPDPPKTVSSAGGLGRAAVWWQRPVENDRFPFTHVHIARYRLDASEDPANPEWEYKGRMTIALEDIEGGDLPTQVNVEELKELATYRFCVIYENEIGESVESDYSNHVKIIAPLPHGWVEYEMDDGRCFYANNKTKQVRWDRPEADPYFIETDLFMKFSRREVKKLKACYQQMDWDHSRKISLEEFSDILGEIGEHTLKEDEAKMKVLWKMAEKDEFGEIGFAAMMRLLDEHKEIKMNHRGFLAKYVCCVCLYLWERRYAPKVGKGGKMLGGDAGLKLGDWQKHMHPMVGRPFYHNVKTKVTTWEMPQEVRFFVNDKLNNDMRRRYDEKQMEFFQKEFQAMDLDGSGAVDEAELGMILENLGENISSARLKGLIKELDKDGSGEIEYEEFLVMIDAVWRGKGSHGWSNVTDATLDEENTKKVAAMKDDVEGFTAEYEEKKLEEARAKGIKYPHGKFCYCGCRKPAGTGFASVVQKSGGKK
ncbi:hypothetical protein TrST_g7375 [Triparma strigata]|uniref:Calmodulin n=1 Tax=Triparma strigata TaxID=1606541 RepID=A0A9W7EXE1_9STRA|nr:hypothetical protein TrST_g7375 [Triparma strigata]